MESRATSSFEQNRLLGSDYMVDLCEPLSEPMVDGRINPDIFLVTLYGNSRGFEEIFGVIEISTRCDPWMIVALCGNYRYCYGAGRTLIAIIGDLAVEQGIGSIELDPINPVVARYYESLGFEWVRAGRMVKRLKE